MMIREVDGVGMSREVDGVGMSVYTSLANITTIPNFEPYGICIL